MFGAIGGTAKAAIEAIISGYQWTLWEQDTALTYVIEDGGIIKGKITTTDPTNPNIKTITSISSQLTEKIATWYKGLRIFALVGLLSVLVYIGIRILISSASEDKAKYKKMLMNWVAAICIVFILHYIMLFIVTLTEQLVDMLKINAITENSTEEILDSEDIAFSSIRNKIETYLNEQSFTQLLGQTIVYLTLVIYTGVFSFQYLKRVVYVAFLTLIAPLIALTYPLDKLKDGKAQAFSMWLKEYIFNCLLQPVHLLLYTIFVGSFADSNFLVDNPLYAVVAVGFLVPAEKFFRKMFGMESQTSVGTIGAAAGGAMVMSMLSKLKGKPPKEEGERQQKVRTANQNGGATGGATRSANDRQSDSGRRDDGEQNEGTQNSGRRDDGGQNNGTQDSGTRDGGGQNEGTQDSGTRDGGGQNEGTQDSGTRDGGGQNNRGHNGREENRVTAIPGQRFMRGVGNVLKTHVGTKDAWKKHGRRARRTIVGAVGGVAGATIGLAAGVATGDMGNVLKYAGTGAVTGGYIANNITDKAIIGASHISQDYQKGVMGIEEYNNKQFDKQFWASDDGKVLLEKYKDKFGGTKGAKEKIQGFLDRGITDTKQMDKMIKNNITPDKYSMYKSNGINDVEKMVELEKENISPEEFSAFENEGITDIYKMKKAKEYAKKYEKRTDKGLTSQELAKRMSIAKSIPKKARDNPKEFKKHIKTRLGLNWDDKDIKELYDELYNLW